ncbi:hypothetical protein ATORI0001_0776 [Lancefieldella rimae ATCC 49626]|uniref:Uncharacterized protein n=1 Tax=Lancefieldella rimae (strain ATCC 49626 / DSM 7090 / CCUG 31168 / NBRC 15546 / VPI D140H-11A) TaxID=553184 RepID=B9CL62_LANR4|nr:hypothetical protein ATORI0001_0776 [Lancefieldella rimae ATCC 49626]
MSSSAGRNSSLAGRNEQQYRLISYKKGEKSKHTLTMYMFAALLAT